VSAAKRPKIPDPGTLSRNWCARLVQGDLPPVLLLLPPTRGEEEPWFADRILGAARQWARAQEDLDLLECDGASPDFSPEAVLNFLGSQGLFGGERVLLMGRATKALTKSAALLKALQAALQREDAPRMVIHASGSTKVVKALAALKGVGIEKERFRRLYGDPPPWKPHDFDASEAAQFTSIEARAIGLQLEPGAAGALVQLVGNHPSELVRSLDHLNLLGETKISAARVHKVVSHGAEGDAFQFSDAILSGNGRTAFRCLRQMEARGLRTFDGKRLAPRDAFGLILSILTRQQAQTEAVQRSMLMGKDFQTACKEFGVPAGGPPARKMEARIRQTSAEHLAKIRRAILDTERHVKVQGWRNSLRALELLALTTHQKRGTP
jgi:DNA polymerase III delta subunit